MLAIATEPHLPSDLLTFARRARTSQYPVWEQLIHTTFLTTLFSFGLEITQAMSFDWAASMRACFACIEPWLKSHLSSLN